LQDPTALRQLCFVVVVVVCMWYIAKGNCVKLFIRLTVEIVKLVTVVSSISLLGEISHACAL